MIKKSRKIVDTNKVAYCKRRLLLKYKVRNILHILKGNFTKTPCFDCLLISCIHRNNISNKNCIGYCSGMRWGK